MAQGDVLNINTNKGQKSVTYISNAVSTNVINDLDASSTWLQLDTGQNMMLYTADTGAQNLLCDLIFSDQYMGV